MSEPSWWDERRTNNRRSRAQERSRARETGGRVSAGSGSSWRQPQDVRTDTELEQVKFTGRKTFTLSADELAQIRKDALNAGRDPQMVVDFEKHHIRAVITIEERY